MNSRLLNRYEEVTYSALQQACSSNGAKVFPKVRVGDVFPLSGSGVSSEHYSYGLRAHFDFLVTNSDYMPLFSVEFDGPLHKTSSVQSGRDRLKNDLCERFSHGLLRINSNYLSRKFRGLDLLSYFVDAWFLEDAFYKAQESGSVPYDEPFDMTFFYTNGSDSGAKWPYWLSLDVQLALQRLHKNRQIGQMAPSHHVGKDSDGNYRCLTWVVFDENHVVYATTGMRAQLFSAVDKADLISMLAMFDLYENIKRALSGELSLLCDRNSFFTVYQPHFEQAYGMVSAGSCGATV
ncbi:DUF2726 domain-containing protein [Acidovorax sp.]|uniref:DUF2726 domain-containing protein n=1 Tax=Acidovorax sp. TaxID=1872122 RepID=UPI002106888B|nr:MULTISPECIES: DUF2726 domain-containing protein [unclassified Acidovorax]QLA80632.1 DUF2726 domain-containing protein [Acidovorax sp. JMULE5]